MKYDDASWHYSGNFPKELPQEAGATHIGMFLSWCILNGLAGELHTDASDGYRASLKNRTITPGAFLIRACDEKFIDEDLSEEGNAFSTAYFDHEKGKYIADYEEVLGAGYATLYHIPDTWESFDRLSPKITQRYQSWKKYGSIEIRKPWWKLWS